MQADLEPYKLWKKFSFGRQLIKAVVFDTDIVGSTFKDHRSYIAWLMKKDHKMIVTRWNHVYSTLNTTAPLFGPVYMRTDSEINPGLEVWFIVGHNIREMRDGE